MAFPLSRAQSMCRADRSAICEARREVVRRPSPVARPPPHDKPHKSQRESMTVVAHTNRYRRTGIRSHGRGESKDRDLRSMLNAKKSVGEATKAKKPYAPPPDAAEVIDLCSD